MSNRGCQVLGISWCWTENRSRHPYTQYTVVNCIVLPRIRGAPTPKMCRSCTVLWSTICVHYLIRRLRIWTSSLSLIAVLFAILTLYIVHAGVYCTLKYAHHLEAPSESMNWVTKPKWRSGCHIFKPNVFEVPNLVYLTLSQLTIRLKTRACLQTVNCSTTRKWMASLNVDDVCER